MKHIFINSPESRDSNSFWRCVGPLSYLSKQSNGEIDIYVPGPGQMITWDKLANFDLIFMHRPCRAEDLIILRMARWLNIPVWSDYDDWLFSLPEWNPTAVVYHNSQTQHIMANIIACSDIVSTTTTSLYNKFKKINDNVVIIPNAYRSDLFRFRPNKLPQRNEIFVWRGSSTHDGDLISVGSSFKDLSKKIHFLGAAPYSIKSDMPEGSYVNSSMMDQFMYWRHISSLSPKVFLFPLADHFFNECKSNIAWIESIHAGAICIAPTLPEWKHPGVIGYEINNPESFKNAAELAMNLSQKETEEIVSESFEYIKSKFDISVVNQFRKAMVDSICDESFNKNNKDPFNDLTGMWALSVLKDIPLPKQEDYK
jgi:hypothetical protein